MTDFEAWARLSARLLRRGPLDGARVIRDAGVEHEWHAADAHWYGELVQDAESGRWDRIERYRMLCAQSRGDRSSNAEAARAAARRWRVEDYAWLCAELERFPERTDAIWNARGVGGEVARQAVREVWKGALDADGELRARFDELVDGYREMLQRR